MGGKQSTHRHLHIHHHHHLSGRLHVGDDDANDIDEASSSRSFCPLCDRSPSYYGSLSSRSNITLESIPSFGRNGDDFESVEEVTKALQRAGVESSNLIIGIDFTISNMDNGAKSSTHKNLHHIGHDSLNPYEQAIHIMGWTLSKLDEDDLIPCFGFGDATTRDHHVFSFNEEGRPCNGFKEVLSRYKEIVPHVRLAGPTSFGPIIEAAIDIVDQTGGQFHILVIIADGQVTRSSDIPADKLSPQEQSTVDAIVKASEYPLSIVVVGVGDGPWEQMYKYDDQIPQRAFDNVQFVNFTEIMLKNNELAKKEAEFALNALMEVPYQYRAILALHLLGKRGISRPMEVLPPPIGNMSSIASSTIASRFTHSPSERLPLNRTILCPLCLRNEKDLSLRCGHQTCLDCVRALTNCPTCHRPITSRGQLNE